MRPTLIAMTALFLAPATLAQDRDNVRFSATRPSHWAFELGAGTDNRSKGASKSDGSPYVFGEAQWNAAGGFYADVEFETIDASGSGVETEAEAGWQTSAAGLDFDASASHKWRLGAEHGHDDAAWEFQFDAMRDFGPADARLRVEHSPDGLGSTDSWTWVEGRLRWPVADQLTAGVTLGRREQDDSIDYTGWNAGVAYVLNDNATLDLRWHDTDADIPGDQYAGRLVAAVLLEF